MDDRLECPPEVSSVRAARLFVVDKLQEWRCDELVDSAALMTSELATNAVIHTRRPFTVAIHRRESGVRVEVADAVPELPRVREPVRFRSGGDVGVLEAGPLEVNDLFSGLGMVDAVATSWGSHLVPDGKIVWFELAVDPATARGAQMADLRDLRSPEPGLAAAVAGKAGEGNHRAEEAPIMARHDYLVDDDDRVVERDPGVHYVERDHVDEHRGGGALRWILVLLVIAALAIGAFFLFGGSADVDTEGDLEVPSVDVDVNAPDVDVNSEEAPPASADANADDSVTNGG